LTDERGNKTVLAATSEAGAKPAASGQGAAKQKPKPKKQNQQNKAEAKKETVVSTR
jgi:hypothetical protein